MLNRSKKVSSHTDCQFGKWCEEDKEKYGHLSSFKQIYQDHIAFHEDAESFVHQCTVVNTRKLLDSSGRILHSFLELINECK